MSVYSAQQLGKLATNLSAIEDWLRQDCPARHADGMADVVREAWQVIEDLYDEAEIREAGKALTVRAAAVKAGQNHASP